MLAVARLLRSMTRWEQWILGLLIVMFLVGSLGVLRTFYLESTVLKPATGGTYIEGSVGSLLPLNPWFIVQNDVNRDIVSLIFSGLLRYDPQSKQIVDDLATMEVSENAREYVLRLKDGLQWHDATAAAPHPVTADDVLFTFKTIQDPQFPNAILQQNFRGVTVEKIDDRTVRFTLERPYSFFPSNLTLGLLPARSFEGIPVSKLDLATDFGYHPVGAGPYFLKTIAQTELSSEVTLERFPRKLPPNYLIDRIVFRIFSDYSSLLSDERNLQGVRLVPRNDEGEPIIPRWFRASQYTLPQYVALFFNLDRAALQDTKLRLGLQLGTNKQALADSIQEPKLVDTPLLELDESDWRYHYDADAAQGALFESNWNMPEKLRLQHLLELHDANALGPLRSVPIVYALTGASLTLTGSYARVPVGSRVHGVQVEQMRTASGTWMVALPLRSGTGALHQGENLVRLTDPDGKILDSLYVYCAKDEANYRRALDEQHVLELFLKTRQGKAGDQKTSVSDMFLEDGMLRLRIDSDPVSVRVNEKGDLLTLHLLTSTAPVEYQEIARFIQAEWAKLGVKVVVDVPQSRAEFEERLLTRDYDVLLFGQSLLDNLDSYPYWHSSGVQKVTGDPKDLRQDAYNLSQYRSLRTDALLETIRTLAADADRAGDLEELRDVIKADVPAIFLYSPTYTFAYHQDIQGIEIGSLSLHSDRFLTMHHWFLHQNRVFKPGKSWFSLFAWMFSGHTASES